MMKKIIASIAVLAAMAVAVPAMASEAPGYALTVGGRIKTDLGWQLLPQESNRNNSDGTIANMFLTLNSNSYFRALFTSADKTTGAHIEFGLGSALNRDNSGGDVGADAGASLRFAYGWWKVGSCKLLVGHYASTLGAIYFPNTNIGHTKSFKSNLSGFGVIGGGTRNPKVGLQMGINDNFSFDVAIGQPGSESTTGTFSNASTNNYLPRLEVVLNFQFGNFSINPGGGISYQQWKYDESAGAVNSDDNALSYLLWLPMQFKTGPFTIALSSYYSQNIDTDWTGEWGTTSGWAISDTGRSRYQFGGQPLALPSANANGDIENTKQWGLALFMDYAFTDQLGISLGGGMAKSNNSAWEAQNPEGRDDYTRWGAYISLPYKVTSNFTVAPEVAYYNYGDKISYKAGQNDSAKDEWLLGIHFQFLF